MVLWSASSIGKRVSLLGVLAVSVWLLTGTPANGQAAKAPAASTAAGKKTFSGTISNHNPFGGGSAGFSLSVEGIAFKLKEMPSNQFRFYSNSFDGLIAAGFMVKDSDGYIKFVDVDGKKIEFEATKDGEYWKTTKVKWLQ